jgi:hypothetical protein
MRSQERSIFYVIQRNLSIPSVAIDDEEQRIGDMRRDVMTPVRPSRAKIVRLRFHQPRVGLIVELNHHPRLQDALVAVMSCSHALGPRFHLQMVIQVS